jgi:hypothetical protein
VRLERKIPIGRVEDGDVAVRRQDPIVLVDLSPPIALGQVLDHADGDHEVEPRVRVRQTPGLLAREVRDLADGRQPELVDLGARDGDEGGVGVEREDLAHHRLRRQALGDVAERAPHLEHGEPSAPGRAEVPHERREEVRPARLAERQIQRRSPRSLALDQHAQDPFAVGSRVIFAVDGEHSAVAEIRETEIGLHHDAPV